MYKYPKLSRFFHHGTVVFLPLVWLFIAFEEQVAMLGLSGIRWHKALGVLFFCWVLGRLCNAFLSPKPPSLHGWQYTLAKLVHVLLYVTMLAMPMLGVFMSVYSDYPVAVFGLFEIPVFVTPNDTIARRLEFLHTEVVAPLLLVLIILHIAAALYHQWVLKDNVVRRMY